MRVLLIEDEPTTAKAIELMLTTEGFNVYSTDLGEEGLDLGKLYDYDIILLDLNLPDMHGYDVLKKLPQTAVHTFDCTLGTHVDHAVRSGKVRGLTFHDACLGMKDVDLQPPAPRAKNATRAPNAIATTGRPRSRFRTWQSLLALAGLTRSPAYVNRKPRRKEKSPPSCETENLTFTGITSSTRSKDFKGRGLVYCASA